MLKIDYNKLRLEKHPSNESIDSLQVNIAGDWAPSLGGISEKVINSQESFYGDLVNLFKTADYNIINLESVIDREKENLKKPLLGSLTNLKS